jgi:hypothetical protein
VPSVYIYRLEGEDPSSSPSSASTEGMDNQGGQEQTNAKSKLQSVPWSVVITAIGLRQSNGYGNQLLGDYKEQTKDQSSG